MRLISGLFAFVALFAGISCITYANALPLLFWWHALWFASTNQKWLPLDTFERWVAVVIVFIPGFFITVGLANAFGFNRSDEMIANSLGWILWLFYPLLLVNTAYCLVKIRQAVPGSLSTKRIAAQLSEQPGDCGAKLSVESSDSFSIPVSEASESDSGKLIVPSSNGATLVTGQSEDGAGLVTETIKSTSNKSIGA